MKKIHLLTAILVIYALLLTFNKENMYYILFGIVMLGVTCFLYREVVREVYGLIKHELMKKKH